MVDLYAIRCPRCDFGIQLLETNLAQITQHPLYQETDDPFLRFVCSCCKHGFQWDRIQTPPAARIVEPPRIPDQKYPTLFGVLTGCADSNHRALVELLSVREHGTTEARWRAEMDSWNTSQIQCSKGHPVPPPDADKVKPVVTLLSTSSGRPF